MSGGCIYILANESMPGLVKIGITDRNPEDRAKELASTGVACPFRVEYYKFVPDCRLVEQLVHDALERQGVRKNENREFFEISIEEATRIIESITRSLAKPDSEPLRAFHLGSSLYDRLKLPRYDEKIEQEDVERIREKLSEIARLGHYNALLDLAKIFRYNFFNSIEFKRYYQEYLVSCKNPTSPCCSGATRNELGKAAAQYLEDLNEMKRITEVDLKFVQDFLITGNQFIYEGFIDYVTRFFSGELKERCLNL